MTPGGSDRPIFIVACPRSGTTMLQLMLHAHARIAIPPETRFLLPTYAQRLEFGDLELRENRRRAARFMLRRGTKFRDLGLDRKQVRREIVAAPPTVGSLIGTVYRLYAERFDRPRWGDKRPLYYAYVEILMRLFPDAQIVHIVRDPRDCLASLKRMQWWKRGTYHALSAWARSIDDTDAAIRRWPDAVTRVSYERLVAAPERELGALAAFLGEEYDPRMAAPERVADVAVPERKHWHAQTRVRPNTESVGRWVNELEQWEIALSEFVLSRRMERLGYERAGGSRPPAEHVLRFAYVHTTRTAARKAALLADRRKRWREPNPVAALLTSGQTAAE